jgi:predicted RNase H-like HicB family nuclease
MKYVYSAIFTDEKGKITVKIPDLPELHKFGNDIVDAISIAKNAIEKCLYEAENKGEAIPPASSYAEIAKMCKSPNQAVSLIVADTDEYRRQNNNRAVKKTLTIPAWLDYKAKMANAPFSKILQQGLKDYLKLPYTDKNTIVTITGNKETDQ